MTRLVLLLLLLTMATPALAGPPYVTDDPQPTDLHRFEIYAYAQGTGTAGGNSGASGIDFNYGGAPDLQLTVVVPFDFSSVRRGPTVRGLGNIELAAKYLFLHQDDLGLDVAFFPRVILPSVSNRVGDNHASVLLPVWMEKDVGNWSVFGGGGCALNRSQDSRDYCFYGAALTRKVLSDLTMGVEIYRQTPDSLGAKQMTGLGGGFTYDFTEHYHLMASYGPGIQNAAMMNRYTWYAALLFTF